MNDMKSLEQQGGSTCTHDTNIDAIKRNINPQCGKCGLSHRKNAQLKVQDVENVIGGTTGNRCAATNKHGDEKPSASLKRQSVGRNPQDKASQGKVPTVEEVNSDFDELCF